MHELQQRCLQLMAHPKVQAHCWQPQLFWSQQAEQWIPRVDLRELEVLLATIAGEVPQYADELDRSRPGRSGFIARNALRGEMPYLTPAHDL